MFITECYTTATRAEGRAPGQVLQWHVGEPLPSLSARVISFQADGDELQVILDALNQSKKESAERSPEEIKAKAKLDELAYFDWGGSVKLWRFVRRFETEMREIRITLTNKTNNPEVTEKYEVQVWEKGTCVGGTWTDNPRLSVTDLEWLEGGRGDI